jgi:hypothetical protein
VLVEADLGSFDWDEIAVIRTRWRARQIQPGKTGLANIEYPGVTSLGRPRGGKGDVSSLPLSMPLLDYYASIWASRM